MTNAGVAIICLRFLASRTPGGKTLPWNRFGLLHGGGKRAGNSGKLLHGWQNLAWDSVWTLPQWDFYARDSGQTFARVAKPCPSFSSDFCTVGYDFPRNQGRLYPSGVSHSWKKLEKYTKFAIFWGKNTEFTKFFVTLHAETSKHKEWKDSYSSLPSSWASQ